MSCTDLPLPPHTIFSKALLYFCVNIPDSIWKRLSVPVSFNEILRGLKYKILLTDKTSSFLPSITNSITIRFQHKYYPVFLGNFRALSHGIFGNFIFLCWLWAFELQLEEKDLFGWQNCHLHTTTDDSRCPTFVQLETNLFFKFTGIQYLVQFYPVMFPLAFRYSSFALLHFQAVIRQYFLSQFFDRLISTEIVL